MPLRRPFQRVVLTGGIATGKSTCLRRFAELGAPVIDADVVARDAVAPGTPALAAIGRRFGASVIDAGGALDRAQLGRLVFNDETARADLERIVHPTVFAVIDAWLADRGRDAADGAGPGLAIAAIPLVFEAGQTHRFDRVVVAACHPAQQLQRLMARDALTEEEGRRRMAAQWPLERKCAAADLVIDTSGSLDDTRRNIDRAWRILTA